MWKNYNVYELVDLAETEIYNISLHILNYYLIPNHKIASKLIHNFVALF